ncbi:MAG: aminoacyl-histidine dipeptidase [Lachnospiraceae bacterium]|nr:aminoacyl-histidine dipeptidase [Lachnospiraceae bacterium]
MRVLEGLEPKEVFYYFEEISNVPRPSYKEDKISAYLVEFAKKHNLEYHQDELKNVIIIKEATEGYENEEGYIIQGHMDMVCEKEPDYEIDFENDPLSLMVNGDFIEAKGTTLGGDDGIAVAYALALLASKDIPHPRLEVVITVSEEVGMEGAAGIDLSMIKSRRLLNIDSEDEGIFLTSCAGGSSAKCSVPLVFEQRKGVRYSIKVDGFMGGHSGTEIDKCRANANIFMGRLLHGISRELNFGLSDIHGGSKENAIPRECQAEVIVKEKDEEKLVATVKELGAVIAKEFATADPSIKVTVTKESVNGEEATYMLAKESEEMIILLLNTLPSGIQAMSANIKGLVETSLNLGIMEIQKDRFILRYAVRSSVESAKTHLEEQLKMLIGFVGGTVEITGDYPAWEYNPDSKMRENMIAVYKEMYGKEPIVEAIHAGLECGILSNKLPGLDCISMGPDMTDIHTTNEKLSISSTKRVWEYLCKVLAHK